MRPKHRCRDCQHWHRPNGCSHPDITASTGADYFMPQTSWVYHYTYCKLFTPSDIAQLKFNMAESQSPRQDQEPG